MVTADGYRRTDWSWHICRRRTGGGGTAFPWDIPRAFEEGAEMRPRFLSLGALTIAGLAALLVFVSFSWFGLGFFWLASLALIAFWAVARPLLQLTPMPAARYGRGSRVERSPTCCWHNCSSVGNRHKALLHPSPRPALATGRWRMGRTWRMC